MASAQRRQQRDLTIETGDKPKRVALLIGNEAYAKAPLSNPVNDARAIGAKLSELGFQVDLALNVNLRSMQKAIDRFVASLRPGDVALFYYAGHGIQLDGENFLIPVDFDAKDEADARYEAYSASRVHERMETSGSRLNLIILDACRNNPFRATRSGAGGLASMNTGRGTFIAFATGPGRTASDNPGGGNGLFTSHLLRAMSEPGLSLDQVFNRVRERVYETSGKEQLPWTGSSVIGEFFFNPASGAGGQQAAGPPPREVEEPPPVRPDKQAAGRTTTSPPAKTVGEPQPAEPAAQRPALEEASERMTFLAARGNAARTSLQRIEKDQARTGVSLRGDISAAWKRMESFLDQAETALKNKDAARAGRTMDLAERDLETLERFLGR